MRLTVAALTTVASVAAVLTLASVTGAAGVAASAPKRCGTVPIGGIGGPIPAGKVPEALAFAVAHANCKKAKPGSFSNGVIVAFAMPAASVMG